MSISRKHILLVVFAVVFVMISVVAGLVAWNNRPSGCGVPIAYVEDDGILIYAEDSKPCKVSQGGSGELLGYDAKNDRWICADGNCHQERKMITFVSNGRSGKLKLEGMSKGAVISGQVAGDTLYVLYEAGDDILRLAAYDFDGNLKHKHALQRSRFSEISLESGFSVTCDGAVALVSRPKGKYSDLLVFNARGRQVRRFDRGISPCFDPAGGCLVFRDSENRNYYNGQGFPVSDQRGSGGIVVLDLRTGGKRTIKDLDGYYWGRSICGSVSGPINIRYSLDGKWLIGETSVSILDCSESLLYAADLSEKAPEWRLLKHISEYRVNWLPLTKEQMEMLLKR